MATPWTVSHDRAESPRPRINWSRAVADFSQSSPRAAVNEVGAPCDDSGPLYAYVDADDAHHGACRELLETYRGPLLVPDLVITEVVHVLATRLGWQPEVRFLGDLASGDFTLEPVHPADLMRMAELVAQYHDLRLPAAAVSAGLRSGRVIEPADTAPDFTLPDQHGNPVKLSDLRGQTVVLYFYPKADTPGCTTQACSVRDHRSDYETAGAVVLGVSPDPVKPIAKFDEKYGLGFPLLSDEDHAVAEAYGVWVEKNRYGRTYMGNERTTFVIGPDGKVNEVFRSVKPGEHDDLVLGALAGA